MKLTETTAHLLTLGFSDSTAQQIMKLRTHLFSLVKHISFVSLPPMVVLAWQEEPFPPLSQLHIPAPPSPLVFRSIHNYNNFLFSVHGTEKFYLWFSQHFDNAHTFAQGRKPLIPPYPGIFLGNLGSYSLPEQLPEDIQIPVSHWRLQQYRIRAIHDQDNLVHVRYWLLDDLHLT
jgi:hypothetical protein